MSSSCRKRRKGRSKKAERPVPEGENAEENGEETGQKIGIEGVSTDEDGAAGNEQNGNAASGGSQNSTSAGGSDQTGDGDSYAGNWSANSGRKKRGWGSLLGGNRNSSASGPGPAEKGKLMNSQQGRPAEVQSADSLDEELENEKRPSGNNDNDDVIEAGDSIKA